MKYLILLIFLLLAFCSASACDMFALLLSGEENFSQYKEEVQQYFNFLISRSSSATNDDGYGIIAYRRNSTQLQPEDYWYKSGNGTWYGDGTAEPLDSALEAVLSDENDYFLVIGHARNATGGSGSHPFRIEANNRTFTMCHNGVISVVLRQAMMDMLGEFWFDEYPSNWLGEYGSLGSFIDSELYHHYLTKYIIDNNYQTMAGLQAAFSETNLLGINPSDYFLNARCSSNMLFSDGTSLYAFRNTADNNAYKLSWQYYDNLIGIKTRDLLDTQLLKNELVQFTPQGEVNSIILEFQEEEPFVPAQEFYAQPNPFRDYVDIYYQTTRADDNDIDDLDLPDKITIYDIRGRKIRTITSSLLPDNYRCYHWDGYIEKGKKAAAGIYLFQHNISQKTGKLVLIK
ncbi:MAG: hypothetical protein K9M99_12330 [Candidatus Cloacimonetes bacterium]|nr:hypothetical protein [Candidatus Cloacimonadota bacterium]